jgi:hypothetical protein
MSTPKIGRNDPCHCGSGNKYKKCHEAADAAARGAEMAAEVAEASARAAAAEAASSDSKDGASPQAGRAKPGSTTRPKTPPAAAPTLFRRRAV